MRHEYVMCQANDIKQKSLLGDNLTKKKDLFSFCLIFYFLHFTLCFHYFLFLFFYFNIEDNVVFKVLRGILVFFVVSVCFIRIRRTHKKYLCFPTLNIKFYLFNFHWFMRIWVLCMRISWDRWKYKLNEWVCMQVLSLISLGIDFENMSCWLNSVVPM
jgi:hypothetical protein